MKLDVVIVTPTVFCDLIFAGLPGIPGPGQEFYSQGFALCPGGMGGNSGIALSRLGMKVGLMSRIGRFPLGEVLYRQLAAEGMELSQVQLADEEPTAVSVAMALSTDRCFLTYPPPSPAEQPMHINFESLRQARHGLVSWPGITKDQLLRIRKMGISITLDIGWDATDQPQKVYELLPFVDVFAPNELEAFRLTGEPDPRKALEVLSRYVNQPVIKLGARGSITLKDGRIVEVPTIDVEPMDTTGAGDVFAAGLLYGYLKKWDIDRCLRLANVCGALSTQVIGGGRSAPRWDDIFKAAPDLLADQHMGV